MIPKGQRFSDMTMLTDVEITGHGAFLQ